MILAAGIYSSLAMLRAARPLTTHWAIVRGVPGFFRFVVSAATPPTDDGRTIIVPDAGGGYWELERVDDRGADLADADATLAVAGGRWRVLLAATLSNHRVLTLDTTGAQRGDPIEVTRLDTSAFTVTIGGITLPASKRSRALFWFDGSAWVLRDAAEML